MSNGLMCQWNFCTYIKKKIMYKKKYLFLWEIKIFNAKQTFYPILFLEWTFALRLWEGPIDCPRYDYTLIFVLLFWGPQLFLLYSLDWLTLEPKVYYDVLVNNVINYSNLLSSMSFIVIGCYYTDVRCNLIVFWRFWKI